MRMTRNTLCRELTSLAQRLRARVWSLLAIVLSCVFFTSVSQAQELVYDGSVNDLSATPSLGVLRVPGAELPLENILGQLDSFEPLAAHGISRRASLGDETYWLHGTVRNATSAHQTLFLVQSHGLPDHVNLYEHVGDQWRAQRSGDHVPRAERPVPFSLGPAFALHLAPGEAREFVVEVRTLSAILLRFQLCDAAGFVSSTVVSIGALLLLTGFLLALAIYNITLFYGTRDRIFLVYAASVCGQVLMGLGMSGSLSLVTDATWFVDGAVNGFSALALAVTIEFGRRYVGVKDAFPRIDRFLGGMVWTLTAWGLVVPWFVRKLDVAVSAPAIGLALLLLLGFFAFMRIRRPNADFFPSNYLLATLAIAIANVTYIAMIRGFIPPVAFFQQAPFLGGALHALILSSGLGERVRLLREEALRSGQVALELAKNQIDEQSKITNEIKRLDHLKDIFLATTSHELRTPIHGILGLADALLDGSGGPLPPRVDRNLRIIVESGRRLSALVNDILDYARLRHADIVMERRPSSLAKCVTFVLDLQRPEALRKGLALTSQVPPDFVVSIDEGRVQQILHNLVGNALKFTAAGFVDVQAHRKDGRIFVEVLDSGPGVPNDARSSIFEPFNQGDSEVHLARQGSGLGLAIARQLAAAHGGTMTYEHRAGVGSVFGFDLEALASTAIVTAAPIATPPRAVAAASIGPVPSAAPLTPRAPNPRAETILVVDDDAINRHVLTQQLSRAGLSVDECDSGAAAIARILSDDCPALVLLDVMMPEISGFDVLDRIRPLRTSTELPVVLLTALARENDIVDGFRHGASDYLTKPFTREELLVRIGHHMSLRRFSMENLEARARIERELDERLRLEGAVEMLREKHGHATTELEAVRGVKRALEIERVEAQRQLIQAEKMASLGQMVTSVAHEIDNPLNYVGGAVAVCERRMLTIRSALTGDLAAATNAAVAGPMNDIDRFLSVITDGVHRLSEVTRAMRNYGRTDDERTDHVNLSTVIAEALVIVGARTRPFELQTDFGVTSPISCHRSHIGQVVLNLVVNAADALEGVVRGTTPDQGVIRLSTALTDDDTGVIICVEDDGPGIPEQSIAAIMKPFFTTKAAGRGTGLGLAICTRIAEEHQGSLVVDRSPSLGGARFTLTFPGRVTLRGQR